MIDRAGNNPTVTSNDLDKSDDDESEDPKDTTTKTTRTAMTETRNQKPKLHRPKLLWFVPKVLLVPFLSLIRRQRRWFHWRLAVRPIA